jgi:hypothetical protein
MTTQFLAQREICCLCEGKVKYQQSIALLDTNAPAITGETRKACFFRFIVIQLFRYSILSTGFTYTGDLNLMLFNNKALFLHCIL